MQSDILLGRRKFLAIICTSTAMLCAVPAFAQSTNYFYASPGNGTWDTTSALWATPNLTSAPLGQWVNGTTNIANLDNEGAAGLTLTMSQDITAQSLVLYADQLTTPTSAGTVTYDISSNSASSYNNLTLASGAIVQDYVSGNKSGTIDTEIDANIVAGTTSAPADLTITAIGVPGSAGASSFGDTTIDLTGVNTFANLHIGGSIANANAFNTVQIDNAAGLPSNSTVYFDGNASAFAVDNKGTTTNVTLQAGNFVINNTSAYTKNGFIVGVGAYDGDTLVINGGIIGASNNTNPALDGIGQGDVQFSVGFSGASGAGTGLVILNGQSNYVGQTRFNSGISVTTSGTIQAYVRLGNNNALPTSTDLVMSYTAGNGGNLDLYGFNQTVGSLSSSVLNSPSIIFNSGGQNGNAPSTLTISGSDSPGTFYDALDDADPNSGVNFLASPGTSAPLSLVRSGTGTTILNNSSSTYSGGTTILGGVVSVSADGDLGYGPNETGNPASGMLVINGGTLAATSSFTLGSNSGRLVAVGPSGPGTGTATISVAAATTLTYNGVISDYGAASNGGTGGSGALTVTGGGTLSLGGANTYSGPTTVSQGTLSLASEGSLSAASAVIVQPGGTFAGFGAANGSVAINGAIAPGSSTQNGTLSVGSLSLNGGGSYAWKLGVASGSPGVGYDTVDVAGALSLNSTQSSPFVINLSSVPGGATFDNTQPYSWTIVAAGSAIPTFNSNIFSVSSSLGGVPGSSFSVTSSGDDLLVNYNPGSTQFYQWLTSASGARTGSWDTVSGNWTSGSNVNVPWNNASGWGAEFSGTPGTVTLSSPITAAGLLFQSGGYTIAGSGSNILTTSSVSIAAGQTETISAPLVSSSLTLSGGGTLVLTSSTNSLSGTTSINAGTLQGNSAAFAGNINVGSGTTLIFDQATNGTYSSNLTGGGSVIKQNTGTLVLGGNDSGFTGAFNITGGTLSISADASSGANAQLGASNPSIVNINGGTLRTTAGITSTRSIIVGNSNSVSPNGTLDVGGQNVVFEGNTASSPTATIYNGGTFTITSSKPGGSLTILSSGNAGSVPNSGTVYGFTTSGGNTPGMLVVNGTSLILGNESDYAGGNNGEILDAAFGQTNSPGMGLTLNNANLTLAGSDQADVSPYLRSLVVTGNSSITLWRTNTVTSEVALFSTTVISPALTTSSYGSINTPLTLNGTLTILPGGNTGDATTNYVGVGTVNLLGNSTVQIVSNYNTNGPGGGTTAYSDTTFRQQSGNYNDNGYTTTFYGGLNSTTASLSAATTISGVTYGPATQTGFALDAAGLSGSTQEATGYWIISNAAGTQGTSVQLGYTSTGFSNNTAITSGNILVNPYGQLVLGQGYIYGWSGQTLTLNGGGCTTTAGALTDFADKTQFLGTVNLGTLSTLDGIDAVSGTNFTLGGNLTGSGTLNKQGAGNLILLGTQTTASGGTQIGNGTITVGDGDIFLAATLPTGNLTFAQTSTSSNSIVLQNTAQSVGNLTSSFSDKSSGGETQKLSLNGNNAIGAVLTVNETGTTTFGNDGYLSSQSSTISGVGSIVLSAATTGTLTFNSANTYTGGTTINGGTLELNYASLAASPTGSPAAAGLFPTTGNILAATGPVALGGGKLLINGATTGSGTNQTIASLSVNAGASAIVDTSNGVGSSLTITSGTLNRAVGATIDFTLPASGNISFGATPTLTNGVLGGWATVAGSSWATLSGSNLAAYSGAMSVSSDSMLAAGTNYDVAASFNATGAANSLRFVNGSTPVAVNLSGAVTITTGGILVPAAVNGTTSITGGTLRGASGGDLVVLQNSASTMTIGSTIADNIAPTGLTLSGSGTLALTGANTYSGTTSINSGILRVDSGGNTGTLGSGPVVVQGSGATLSFDRSDTAYSVSSVISGSGAMNQIGGGTVTLNAANALTGQTSVVNGIFQLGNTAALQNSTVNLVGSNPAPSGLAFSSNIGTFTIGGLTGSGGLELQSAGGGVFAGAGTASPDSGIANSPVTLQVGNNNSTTTYTGSLGGSGGLTKIGAGTLTLAGTNTYSGTTAINGGTLRLDFTAATSPASNIVLGSSTLSFGGGTLAINGNTNGSNQTVAGLVVNPGASAILNTSNGSGASALTISGAINRNVGGTLDFTEPASGSISVATAPTLTGGILGGWATVAGSDWATVSGGNIVALPAANYTNDTWAAVNNTSVTVDDTPSFNSTTNSLRFASTTTGNLVTLAGTNVITTGGILVASPFTAAGTITGGTLEGSSGGDLIIDQNSVSNFTISSVIADNGGATGLTKSGPGTLVLGTGTSASNTFTGPVYINQGTIMLNQGLIYSVIASGNVFTASNVINFGSNGQGTTPTLNLNGLNATVAGLNSNANAMFEGTSVAFTQAETLTIAGGGTYDYAGTFIDGAGALSLTVSGAGTQILSGADSWSGPTTITSGTLQIGNGGPTGSLGSATVTDNSSLVFDLSSNVTVPNLVQGSGALSQIGAGTTTLTATNNYSGGTFVTNGMLVTAPGATIGGGQLSLNAAAGANAAVLLGTSQSVSSISNATALGGASRISVVPGLTLTSSGPLTNTGNLSINTTGQAGGAIVVESAPTLNANSNIQVNSGSLEFNVTNSTTATVQSNASITVGPTAMLLLAGTTSALSDGSATMPPSGNLANVNNHGSTASAGGFVVSGSNQSVGVVSGTNTTNGDGATVYDGDTTVGSGTTAASLTATQILQNSLTINAGSTLTIAPSNGESSDVAQASSATSFASPTNSLTGTANIAASESPLTAIQAAIDSGAISQVTGQTLEGRIAAIERLASTDPGLDASLLESRVLAALANRRQNSVGNSPADLGGNLLALGANSFASPTTAPTFGGAAINEAAISGSAFAADPAAVPEPSGLLLVVIGLTIGLIGNASFAATRRRSQSCHKHIAKPRRSGLGQTG